jgi:hypothetical protein
MPNLSDVPTAASIAAFAATDSNLSASSLAERVLSQYTLGVISRCRLHGRGLNDIYKVETERGETYYLRVYYAGRRSREAIETEIAMLLHIAQQNVNVSAPVGRTDSEFLTNRLIASKADDGRYYSRPPLVKSWAEKNTPMNWPSIMAKRPLQFIVQRTASKGRSNDLHSILNNCWSGHCVS